MTKGMSVETAVALLTEKISNAILAVHTEAFAKVPSTLILLGGVAQGLLASPNDNLKIAHKAVRKGEKEDMYKKFASVCVMITKELINAQSKK